jgi:hypothetical protein
MNFVSVSKATPSRGARADIEAPAIASALRIFCVGGRYSLVLLAAALPFEVTQRPLLRLHTTTISNLELLFYIVAAAAVATVALAAMSDASNPAGRSTVSAANWNGRRMPALVLLSLIAVALLSSVMGDQRQVGIKWSLHLAAAGAIWMVAPLWLDGESPARGLSRSRLFWILTLALVAGAVVSALLGMAEMVVLKTPSSQTSTFLFAFKDMPTFMGPYLRLSGTFQYANIAAGYFAMVTPFALVALLREAGRGRRASMVRCTLWGAALATLLTATLLTYSRGGALAAGAGIVTAVGLIGARRVQKGVRGALRSRFVWLLGGGIVLTVAGGFLAISSPGSILLRLRTQSDLDWYRATFTSSTPQTLVPGKAVRVPLAVKNTGALAWRAGGQNPYHISYHWLVPSGRVAVFDGYRTDLPADVSPGATVRAAATVVAPTRPGRYLLVWDVVQENVLWFSIHLGAYTVIPVSVRGKPVTGGVPPEHATYSHPGVLPQAPPEPNRPQLWAAAWRMIRAQPLLGVGPDGYRLNYGSYTTPRLATWDTRVYANSLPLEVAADLGVIGAALFIGFLLMNLWPLVRVAWGTSSWAVAMVAALVAFCAHGVFDYLLGDHAVFILFWLLLACAAAAGCAAAPKSHAWRAAGVT